MTLDFSHIRTHNGSQDGGFEELVCQLAHLSPPINADYFVRKEGAGGDAGVECYWKLKDGTEYGWQAKYFLDVLNPGQWSQISKSVETALDKHPTLVEYYICLPRDWTDSRKAGKAGDTVKSAWDIWEDHVRQWNQLASTKGMNISFKYWGKHEISMMLQQDDPLFSGRAQYWFNELVLTHDTFLQLVQKSRNTLGERYTPELNIDLPIKDFFDAVGVTEVWWKKVQENVNEWRKSLSGMETSFFRMGSPYTDVEPLKLLIRKSKEVEKILSRGLREKVFIENIHIYESRLSDLQKEAETGYQFAGNTADSGKNSDSERNYYLFLERTIALSRLLKSDFMIAAQKGAVLITGDAGVGKSHLLCDVAIHRLENRLPTIFILGQHYLGRDPLKTLIEELDVTSQSKQQFLAAFDAAGEASRYKALIIVDAINEGKFRDDWFDYLASFLTDLKKYSHISVVLSCRSTFLEYLIPEDMIGKHLILVRHLGFNGHEHAAASQYLSRQGIAKPSAPIMAPEFSNPLFLKVTCKALKERGENRFPKGLQGLIRLFEFYVNSIEHIIARGKKYRPGENIVQKVLKEFAKALYPDNLYGIPIQDARALIENIDPKSQTGESLFDYLINEGVLSEDIAPDESAEFKGFSVVRFTYERFSDLFIAEQLLSDYTSEAEIVGAFQMEASSSFVVTEVPPFSWTPTPN